MMIKMRDFFLLMSDFKLLLAETKKSIKRIL